MGYAVKTFDGKYWNRSNGSDELHGWVDDLQNATVYRIFPTIVVNNRIKKCYIIKVKIVEVDDPKCITSRELMLRRDEFWQKNLK